MPTGCWLAGPSALRHIIGAPGSRRFSQSAINSRFKHFRYGDGVAHDFLDFRSLSGPATGESPLSISFTLGTDACSSFGSELTSLVT